MGLKTRMAAEQAAAAVLLAKVPEPNGKASPAAGSANPVGLLQERCQGAGDALPTYEFSESADSTFIGTVTVANRAWQGVAAASKSSAKKLAAEAALRALQA